MTCNGYMAESISHPLEELDEEQCWRLLEQKSVGRLAISIANKPDIFPVNYDVDNKTLLLRSAAGLKLAGATLGEAVAFEVDALHEATHTGWSVVVKGKASEITGVEQVIDAEDHQLETWAEGVRNRHFRIDPEQVTGRRLPAGDRY